MEKDLKIADRLLEEKKYDECAHLLGNLHNKSNSEFCWRQARVIFMQRGFVQIARTRNTLFSVHGGSTRPTKHEVRAQLATALEHIHVGLVTDGHNADCLTVGVSNSFFYPTYFYTYQWNGILVDQLSKLEGGNERTKTAFKTHDLWQKALLIDPKNYLANNCLGIWFFEVNDLPDIKQSLTKTFSTKPSISTYEEALKHLNRCEELAPRKLVSNLLTLAKCHYHLKNKDKARYFCQAVNNFQGTGFDVTEAQSESHHLLKKL
ncbi:hypothetical protein EG68_10790 [Paragonimus skrjabini miyazakii]|uniref:Regulator of microtubule dynamics protein 1 n=1 Tax=Paragonimus skrjabini miyazakii TaxID=59628 RepID=A0A8S9YMA9_9TREM|nr:hypothetical protein EG68_10790 [Paragonimus skrjabini miyazakii]